MTCDTVLLKPHVVHIHILKCKYKKLDYLCAIMSTINYYCLSSRIFKEEQSDDGHSPKSAKNMWMHLFRNNHLWIFRKRNASILLFNKVIKMKMSVRVKKKFVWKINIYLFYHNPFNDVYSLCLASRLHFLSQLNFVSMKMHILRENTVSKASRNVQCKTTVPNWCSWTLSTLSCSVSIFCIQRRVEGPPECLW